MSDPVSIPAQATGAALTDRFRPPWTARSVQVAALIMLLGVVFWVRDRWRAAEAPAPAAATSSSTSTGFAPTSTGSPAPDAAREAGVSERRVPATFRFGAGYLGGFFLGWGFRRFLKATTLIAGAGIAGIGLLKWTGWIEADWAGVEEAVRSSLGSLQRGAEGVKEFLTGHLPSATATTVGLFLGFRRR